MSNQILIFGCNGQLGKSISDIFPNSIKYSRAECDFNNLEDISKTILRIKPEVIINCAAYTDVNNSETNIKKALKINSIAVKVIASSANIIGALGDSLFQQIMFLMVSIQNLILKIPLQIQLIIMEKVNFKEKINLLNLTRSF